MFFSPPNDLNNSTILAKIATYVRLVNDGNAIANKLWLDVASDLAPFLGQKILEDGNLIGEPQKRVSKYLKNAKNEIVLCAEDEGKLNIMLIYGTYAVSVVVGEVKNDILVNIPDDPRLRTGYTFQEVKTLMQAYEDAYKALVTATNALGQFPKAYN